MMIKKKVMNPNQNGAPIPFTKNNSNLEANFTKPEIIPY
jgi:hypothetical protein